MKKIAILTGTRAEYGILKPIIEKVRDFPKFELALIVTGMHLVKEFGNSIDIIIKDGFNVDYQFPMHPQEDSGYSMSKAISDGIAGSADALKAVRPDLVIVLGDRTEALAMTIAAAYMNIPIAHFSGGDRTGGIDDSTRHAISKFAHIHFPATQESADRLQKLGEDPWRIFQVGEPSLDTILNAKLPCLQDLTPKLGFEPQPPYLLLVQHAVTTESGHAHDQILETLKAVEELQFQTIVIYPNSDAGGREIIDEIKRYESRPFIHAYQNLSHVEYLALLKHSAVLVGNSSSGITEAPSFKIPVVDIGTRQMNRQKSTNIIHVDYNAAQIKAAIEQALHDPEFQTELKKCVNPYGDGKTGDRVLKILENLELDQKWISKQIAY